MIHANIAHEVSGSGASIMELLRWETRTEHTATERTALAQAMIAKRITVEQFRLKLWLLLRLRGTLERAIDRGALAQLGEVWDPTMSKSPQLACDLLELGGTPTIPGRLAEVVGAGVGQIEQARAAELCGWLYVLEGSSLGGQVLLPRLAEALASDGRGLSYYRGHGDSTRARWAQFGARMDQRVASEQDKQLVVRAARLGFGCVRAGFTAIAGDAIEEEASA